MDYSDKEHPAHKIVINPDTDNLEIQGDCLSSQVVLRENGIPDCNLTANNDEGLAYLAELNIGDEVEVYYRYEDGADDWVLQFRGNIFELSPNLSKSGEIVSVVCYGKGYGSLKMMRASAEYGTQSIVSLLTLPTLPVVGFDGEQTDFYSYGLSPWLSDDDESNYITAFSTLSAKTESSFNFEQLTGFSAIHITSIKIGIMAKMYSLSCTITISVWDGSSWVDSDTFDVSTSTYTKYQTKDFSRSIDTLTKLNALKIKITYEIQGGGFPSYGTVAITQAQADIIGIGMVNGPTTLREIICNKDQGLVPKFAQKIFGGDVSGYTLNTDYVYDYPDIFTYLNFPYEDLFTCVQDIAKTQCAMEASKNWTSYAGIHWIVDPDGNLLLAPVGNHNVLGRNSDYVIESKWATRGASIVVKEDMIETAFKTEIHPANCVLVAGKYVVPKNDLWCEPDGFASWVWTESHDNDAGDTYESDGTVYVVGTSSIKVSGSGAALTTYGNSVTIDGLHVLVQDFTKIITNRSSKVSIAMQLRHHGSASITLRLYTTASDYFEYDLQPYQGSVDDVWVTVMATIDWNDMIDIALNNNWTKTGSPTWDVIQNIGLHFHHDTVLVTGYTFTHWIDGMTLIGNCIRGATDSTLINDVRYGCRTLTIKDSLAEENTLDPTDDSSSLAQTALFELMRNRLDITSGAIKIPLDVNAKAGQIRHITYGVIDRNFRVVKVTQNVSKAGAYTQLELVDDITNSVPYTSTDPFTVIARAVNPDFQSKTQASIRSGSDFTAAGNPIIKDYPS